MDWTFSVMVSFDLCSDPLIRNVSEERAIVMTNR